MIEWTTMLKEIRKKEIFGEFKRIPKYISLIKLKRIRKKKSWLKEKFSNAPLVIDHTKKINSETCSRMNIQKKETRMFSIKFFIMARQKQMQYAIIMENIINF